MILKLTQARGIINIFGSIPIRFSFLLLWKCVLVSAMTARQVLYLQFQLPESVFSTFSQLARILLGINYILFITANSTADLFVIFYAGLELIK